MSRWEPTDGDRYKAAQTFVYEMMERWDQILTPDEMEACILKVGSALPPFTRLTNPRKP